MHFIHFPHIEYRCQVCSVLFMRHFFHVERKALTVKHERSLHANKSINRTKTGKPRQYQKKN